MLDSRRWDMRTGKYKNYVRTAVKLPQGLKERIDELARKSDVKRNGWIVKALAREARWDGTDEPTKRKKKEVKDNEPKS